MSKSKFLLHRSLTPDEETLIHYFEDLLKQTSERKGVANSPLNAEEVGKVFLQLRDKKREVTS